TTGPASGPRPASSTPTIMLPLPSGERLSHPPRRIAAIFARLIQAQPVARRIGQPRLAPAPILVLRHLVERDPAPRQIGDPGVERAAFQIGRRAARCPGACIAVFVSM